MCTHCDPNEILMTKLISGCAVMKICWLKATNHAHLKSSTDNEVGQRNSAFPFKHNKIYNINQNLDTGILVWTNR